MQTVDETFTAPPDSSFEDATPFAPAPEPQVELDRTAAAPPRETDEEAFARLAALPLPSYDRAREGEAERLGIRLATLDAQVGALRPAPESGAQGGAVRLPDVEPWPEGVDGGAVLEEVAAVFERFLVLPPRAADALALWTAHAHCFEAFVHTPRLNAFSPEKGCGKTLLLDVLGSMVPRPLRTESLTAPVLFRLVDLARPTLLLDETDTYLGEAEELRGLLNAGHKRGAMAYRCEGDSHEIRGFAAFAPAALAGIGSLPGTLHDRSIVIRLVRAKPGEVKARFDSRRTAHENELCRKLARWTQDNRGAIEAADPSMPEGAFNRTADNWRPLFAIAEQAGGDWPARATGAFDRLTACDDLDAQGTGALLLSDIRDVFATERVDKLPSARLADCLATIEGRPWHEFGKAQKPVTPNQVAKLLRRFDLAPHTVRAGKDTWKGYELTDFTEVFERYLPHPPIPNRHTVTTPANIDDSSLSEPSQPETVSRFENAVSPNKDGHCDRVTVGKRPVEEKEALLL